MWTIRISINGQSPIWVSTGHVELREAENYCRNLYGDDIVFVGQEFK